jgi:transposase-like protein
MEPSPPCPHCGHVRAVVKAGFNRSGSQRYRCQACHHYFTPAPKPAGHDLATRDLAVRLYLEGTSFRGIAKVLRVNHASVIHWVTAAARQLPPAVTDATPTETVETDELFTFIGKKRPASMS